MEGIEFEEIKDLQNLKVGTNSGVAQKPSFIFRVLEKAGITDKNTANLVLLAIAIVAFGFSFYLYSGLLGSKNLPKLTPEQLQTQLRLLKESRMNQNK